MAEDPTPPNPDIGDCQDTIAAIATPLGEGGLALIRLSGPRAVTVVDRVFRPGTGGQRAKRLSHAISHTLHYGRIMHDNAVLDEVMVAVMLAPRTYTRENVVEIGCHGGMLASKRVLDAVLASGARLAEPGEFTKRAFLNGRLDLTQAEAVADLIHARTELALAAAQEQLAGHLSLRVNQLRDDLMSLLAHVEAQIDFPDEDIQPDTQAQLAAKLTQGIAVMDDLLQTAGQGRILRRGIRAAIVGLPNVGKSTLLNRLLGQDRAIVSHLPGTTRDTIEETADVLGIPVVFIDTAGLRASGDEVEAEGVRRSRRTAIQSELVLYVLDSSQPLSVEDKQYLETFSAKKRLIVCNKSDLPARLELTPELRARAVHVCATSGSGIDKLRQAIRELVWGGEMGADMLEVMINSRHESALRRSREAAGRALAGLSAGDSLELVALELRQAAHALGEIVGKTTTDDLLDSIFHRFCLGK